jgi:hypothetical protein
MIVLSHLRQLLASEFSEAETFVRYGCGPLPEVQEVEITAVFCVEVERRLQVASDEGRIAYAVRRDLEDGFHRFGVVVPASLSDVTDGLVARVSRRRPAEEERDGGDFGLLAIEPVFRFRWHNHFDLERGGRKNGILVQAKRRPYGGAWNRLTETQESVLGPRMAHVALLRYEFDDLQRNQLVAFRWNVLAGAVIGDVTTWLRSGQFPESVDTATFVAGVSAGRYGTSDPNIIEDEICSDARASMIVEVDWKDEDDPGDALVQLNRDLQLAHAAPQEVRIRL